MIGVSAGKMHAMPLCRSSFMLLLAAACSGSASKGLWDRRGESLGVTAKAPNAFESFRHFDALARAGYVPAIATCYDDAGSPARHAFVRSCAEADAALSKLEMAVTGRFGAEAAADAIHATGQRVLGDVQDVVEDLPKGIAKVHWKGGNDTMTLVLVKGQWKLSLNDMLKGLSDEKIRGYGRRIHRLADELTTLASRVEQGGGQDADALRGEISELTARTVGSWDPGAQGNGG